MLTREMVLHSYVLCSDIVTFLCDQAGVNNLLINEATCGAKSLGLHAFIKWKLVFCLSMYECYKLQCITKNRMM